VKNVLLLCYFWKVYSCDFGDDAEITPEKSMITQVAGLSEKRVVDIACGYCHCLALTSDGKVKQKIIINCHNENDNDSYELNDCNLGICLGREWLWASWW